MTRRQNALLEIVKRGGTINERKIACEKLMLLTGKNYSHLLPKEEKLRALSIRETIAYSLNLINLK